MKKKRVAAYARVSTDKDDQANSFESQVKYFKNLIDREEDWELVKIYSDEGITGTQVTKRQGFKNMITDAKLGRIDLIITKEVSRFARNVLDSIAYTRQLKDCGVTVKFMLDGIDTSQPDSELRLTIMAAIAQEESRKTSERVKWGQKRQMEKGVVFGRSMLGYKVEGGKLYLVEEEAEIVRLIFHKFLVEGKGTHVIARELKEAGIKPCNPDGIAKFKNDWSNTVIGRVLRNEKYVGDLVQKKTRTANFLDHKKTYNRGEEEKVVIKNHHPEIAIISREIWDATQKELKRRRPSEEQRKKHSNRYWASGKIICGACGGSFKARHKKTESGSTMSWICGTHNQGFTIDGEKCTMSESVSDKSLKSCVLYILNLLVDEKDELLSEIKDELLGLSEDSTNEKKQKGLKSKIEKLEEKKIKLIDLRLSGEITSDELQRQKEYINAEIETLRKQFDAMQFCYEDGASQVERIQALFAEVESLLSFQSENMDEILSTVVDRIKILGGNTIEVYLKDLPMGFRVTYHSTGKLSSYRTEIKSCEMI